MSFSCRLSFEADQLVLDRELSAAVEAAGTSREELEHVVVGRQPDSFRDVAARLLAACCTESVVQADMDVLLDVVLGIHEVRRRPAHIVVSSGSLADDDVPLAGAASRRALPGANLCAAPI